MQRNAERCNIQITHFQVAVQRKLDCTLLLGKKEHFTMSVFCSLLSAEIHNFLNSGRGRGGIAFTNKMSALERYVD